MDNGFDCAFAWRWGVDAERKPPEAAARPLTFLLIWTNKSAERQQQSNVLKPCFWRRGRAMLAARKLPGRRVPASAISCVAILVTACSRFHARHQSFD